MHPVSVSLQKRARGAEYHHLSYSAAGKSHTQDVISGTGLGNLVTMFPKFHTIRVPWLGRNDLELSYSFYAHLFWGIYWIIEVLWFGLVWVFKRLT